MLPLHTLLLFFVFHLHLAFSETGENLFSTREQPLHVKPTVGFRCPLGFHFVGNSCFLYQKSLKLPWKKAQKFCKTEHDANLVQFETKEEWYAALAYLQHRHQNCYLFQNTFIWTGISGANTTSWQHEELAVGKTFFRNIGLDNKSTVDPSDAAIALSCGGGFQWLEKSKISANQYNFICEANPTVHPHRRCPKPFHLVGESCYFLNVSDSTTWLEASTKCAQLNKGQLLSVETENEAALLKEALTDVLDVSYCLLHNNISIWTDGVSERGRSWIWVTTGQNLTYFDWAENEPDSHAASAIVLNCGNKFQWSALQLGSGQSSAGIPEYVNPYICETVPRIVQIEGDNEDSLGAEASSDMVHGDLNSSKSLPNNGAVKNIEKMDQSGSKESSNDSWRVKEDNAPQNGTLYEEQKMAIPEMTVTSVNLEGHDKQYRILACKWSPTNSNVLWTISGDGTIRSWEFSSFNSSYSSQEIQQQVWLGEGDVDLAWKPNGLEIVVAASASDLSYQVFSSAGDNLANGTRGGGTIVKYSPEGTLLASGTNHGIEILDMETGELTMTFRAHSDKILALDWRSEDILASGSEDNTINVYNVTEKRVINTFFHRAPVKSVKWDETGCYLASFSEDNKTTIWAFDKQAPVVQFSENAEVIYSFLWGPEGKQHDTGGSLDSVNAGLSRLKSVLQSWVFKYQSEIISVSFSPDRKLLATVGKLTSKNIFYIVIWSMESMEKLYHDIVWEFDSNPRQFAKLVQLSWNKEGTLLAIFNFKHETVYKALTHYSILKVLDLR